MDESLVVAATGLQKTRFRQTRFQQRQSGLSEVSPRAARRALLVVSTAVLLGSSTWLSGTAVAPILKEEWRLDAAESAWLTSSVQLGFIFGTLLYALLNLADRFNARRVFFFSAALGAGFNGAFGLLADGLSEAVLYRFLTGVTLAGVYPVGMKIVATWFRTGLGNSLGIMVGALVLGTRSSKGPGKVVRSSPGSRMRRNFSADIPCPWRATSTGKGFSIWTRGGHTR